MQTLKINPKWIEVLPNLLSFSLAAFCIWKFDLYKTCIALILGVIAGGLVELDHRLSGRLKNLLWILVGFALSSTAVQLALTQPLAITLVLTSMAFIFPMFGVIDLRYRQISFGMLTVAVYTTLADNPELPWYTNPIMIVCGALIYQACSTLCQFFLPNRPIQEAIANDFFALSQYIENKASFFAPDEKETFDQQQFSLAQQTETVSKAFNQTRDRLFYRLSGQHKGNQHILRKSLHDFLIAQDIHERISASHVDYVELCNLLENSDVIFRIERLVLLQAKVCKNYAQGQLKNQIFYLSPEINRAGEGLQKAWQYFQKQHPNLPLSRDIERLIRNLLLINASLNQLGKTDCFSATIDTILQDTNVNKFAIALLKFKENINLSSPYFRHALRLAIMSFIICLIIETFHLHLGFWIYLTFIFVTQLNYLITYSRVTQRIIGTVLGVIIGAFLPIIVNEEIPLLILLVLSNTLFFYFRARNYSFSTIFITIQVFIGFSLLGLNTLDLLANRLIDTFIGAGLSLFSVYFLWPDWKYVSLDKTMQNALEADQKYFQSVLSQLGNNGKDNIDYRIARRQAHEAAGELATLSKAMRANPKQYGEMSKIAERLTQLNYRIVSQISTLGTYRDHNNEKEIAQIQDLAIPIVTHFSTIGKIKSVAKNEINSMNYLEITPIKILTYIQLLLTEIDTLSKVEKLSKVTK